MLIERDRLHQVAAALEDVCIKLSNSDVVGLTRCLASPVSQSEPVPSQLTPETTIYHFRTRVSGQQKGSSIQRSPSRGVAWVFHLIDPSDVVHMDPSLAALGIDQKTAFCDRWSKLCEPVVMDSVDIRSSTAEVVRLFPILLPVTSQWMLNQLHGRNLANARRLVQKAVDVAAALHCNVVTLGQFTSIASRGGKSLDNRNMQITAGSNYTVALVSQAIRSELQQRSWDSKDLTLGIVGAAGDIASTCAAMMAPEYRECILVGSQRAGSLQRLNKVARGIHNAKVATSLQAIEDANVVICATNSTTALLGADCLHSNAIVCDASVPATLQQRVGTVLPSLTVFPGAIASLPGKEQLDIPGFPLPTGFTYGCMAEGLLLGLDANEGNQWSGRSSLRGAHEISQVAARHGFAVAERSSLSNVLGSPLCPR
jgi:predicted amino acid dehydrogenase